MDSFPVGTNIAAYNRPFAGHASVVAGRVFEVPFEVVYDRVGECQALAPFHYLADRSNVMEAAFVPMVRPVMMEDLNLQAKRKSLNKFQSFQYANQLFPTISVRFNWNDIDFPFSTSPFRLWKDIRSLSANRNSNYEKKSFLIATCQKFNLMAQKESEGKKAKVWNAIMQFYDLFLLKTNNSRMHLVFYKFYIV